MINVIKLWGLRCGLAATLVLGMQAGVLLAGKCCEISGGCSGCKPIGGNSYVSIGNNPVARCASVQQPYSCDETSDICVTLTNADVYGDANCGTVVGTTSLSIYSSMCNNDDDACNAG